ncbi:Ig heavy chain Mem5-like [Alligator mississippiensis]|uniref:Ig heavy chain Mem5-like n=1 Tax=Alligator mississippiensis TaxID=8496 RepID=A0A151MAY5_ALLMI|nr:Ig heavy chain Mem5-like [Alligator mississippiensis]
MPCFLVGMILFCLQMAISEKGVLILQRPTQLFLASGGTAQLKCSILGNEWRVAWYKEQPGGSLHGVYHSSEFAKPVGRYSGTRHKTTKQFSLVIEHLQREDAGIYYCSPSGFNLGSFGDGTRLIVTDAPQPSLAILAPPPSEEADIPGPVPVLCLLSPHALGWKTTLWDVMEEPPEQMDAGALDGESMWIVAMVPKERWDTGKSCTCTAREEGTGRNISAAVAKGTGAMSEGPCWVVRWVGLPCVCLLLLVQGLILLSTKCPIKGQLSSNLAESLQ